MYSVSTRKRSVRMQGQPAEAAPLLAYSASAFAVHCAYCAVAGYTPTRIAATADTGEKAGGSLAHAFCCRTRDTCTNSVHRHRHG